MRVWKRILVKFVILVLVITGFGAVGIALKESRQATAQFALEQYAQYLIDHEIERAYQYLDRSSENILSANDFVTAVEAKKYSLYAGYHLEKTEEKRDNAGNEFQDYRIAFVNSDDEVQLEENISVKKQAEKLFFFFDRWRILPDHCMVKDFELSVPVDSAVVLDGKTLDKISESKGGKDVYRIPEVLPGKLSIDISHPLFNSIVTNVDTMEQSADFCGELQLSGEGKASGLEMSVKTLKALYREGTKAAEGEAESAIQETDGGAGSDTQSADGEAEDDVQNDDTEEIFADCREKAESIIKELRDFLAVKAEEGSEFKSIAVSGFNPRYGEISFTEQNGIRMEMDVAYHYLWKFQQTVTVDTGEYDADGYAITEETVPGDAAAKLVLFYYNNEWHLSDVEISGMLG